jgi:serine/threonine-protein kinase
LPAIREQRPDVSLELAECVHLMLAKSPQNRPRDGAEAMQLIQAVLGQVRDLHTLLEEALAGEPSVTRTKTESGERLQVTMPDGRGQTVHIEQTDHSGPDRLLMIYSICCPATEDYFEAALRLNATVCHGALAIRSVEGQDQFVMIDAYPRATVDPEEIRRSVLEIAVHADAVESQLTGLDNN